MNQDFSSAAEAQTARYDAASGWLTGVRRVPSPNHDERPAGAEIDLVIVHGISLPPGEFGGGHIDQLFTNTLDPAAHPYFAGIAGRRVSAHLLIDRAGRLTQYVPLTKRAWHAGESVYCGRSACNDYAIGVELEGGDEISYTAAQYDRLTELLGLLLSVFPALSPARIVGHSDVAPARKTDPGPAFEWARMRMALRRRESSAQSGEVV